MPALPLQTDAFVLGKRPPSDSFQGFTVFSAEHGALLVLQRLPKKTSAVSPPLDLFDEASLSLESSNQGQTWFVKESRVIMRHPDLGRSYETLRHASALAALVARNPVLEESRAVVAALLRQALASFASGARPDYVWFKSLYRFARDEGYPVKEQWFPTLPAADRDAVATLLNRPLAELLATPPLPSSASPPPPSSASSPPQASASPQSNPMSYFLAPDVVARLVARLEDYLRGHTEILLD